MDKRWERRLRSGKNAQLGRISQISPKTSELFYLRLLLIYRTGPKSFEHLRTIGGFLREFFMAAAGSAMGILDDDHYSVKPIEDAVPSRSINRLRRLFAVILLHCEPQQLCRQLLNYAGFAISCLLVYLTIAMKSPMKSFACLIAYLV